MREQSLRAFGRIIQRLVSGNALTRQETYAAFGEVLRNGQPDLQQGAFLAALVAKGETAAEIAGAWEAIDGLDTVHVEGALPKPVADNCGTGMDAFKTFNVSTAAAIVAAACGVSMARHGARALTSSFGTVDMAEALGVDVACGVEIVARSIREAGIGLFNGMCPTVHPVALGRILSQIRFGSTLNIAASLANPGRPSIGVRGVYAEEKIDLVADVMRQIGYDRGMVVHGKAGVRGGLDELSVCGETVIREFFPDGTSTRYTLLPEQVGLRRADASEIAAHGDLPAERHRFLRVLSGLQRDGSYDFVCLNAAAVLYVAGHAPELTLGIRQSREAIESGAALRTLHAWVAMQNREPAQGLRTLQLALRDAG